MSYIRESTILLSFSNFLKNLSTDESVLISFAPFNSKLNFHDVDIISHYKVQKKTSK